MIPLYRELSNRALLAHSGEIGEIVIALPGYGIAVARTIDEKRGRSGDFGFSTIYRRALGPSRSAIAASLRLTCTSRRAQLSQDSP